jgi:hypothetical protein
LPAPVVPEPKVQPGQGFFAFQVEGLGDGSGLYVGD